MPLLIKTSKTENKMSSCWRWLNASITTQLVKQKASWTAIEDHNAYITTHIEKQNKNNNNNNNNNKKQKAMREPQSYKE